MAEDVLDLLVVGGGINGAAIAREAALNGWRVLLVERDDLARHTSSASTKLIHGGLRYLETYDFRLVAHALGERARLVRAAPNLIHPLRFVLPHTDAVRPWWLVRAGLYLYDALGGRGAFRTGGLKRSRGLGARDGAYLSPLKEGADGFVYSDASVDDARLTVLNAMDAAANGAELAVGTALLSARREGDRWCARLSDGRAVRARALVNAAGPWVEEAMGRLGVNARAGVRLVKGSHIVVPRLYDGDHAYILQLADRRIVFAIPYEGGTQVGTTDVAVERPEDAVISDNEVRYLCDAVNRHFRRQVTPADVTATWSGVRPLYDDGASEARQVTRDYVLELDGNVAPLLSVFGGKITTARHLGEEAVGKLGRALGRRTRRATLDRPFPGGDTGPWPAFLADVRRRYPWLGDARSERMARAYGTLLHRMLAGVGDERGMGRAFGAGLTEVEARWMHDREWARAPEDALERRSKLGLHLTAEERAAFVRWWAETFPVRAAAA